MVKKYKKLMFTFSDWNSTLPVENSPKTPHGIRLHWNLPAGQEFTWIHCISTKPLWSAVINSNLTFCLSSTYISSECLYKSTKQADRGIKSKVSECVPNHRHSIGLTQLSSVAIFGSFSSGNHSICILIHIFVIAALLRLTSSPVVVWQASQETSH